MAKASNAATINPLEASHFGSLAADWWNPKGSSAMLHKLNPVRLGFVRAQIDAHWAADLTSLKPLVGKSALDVGCGAGLLAEPLARLGATMTGVDAAPENIAVARDHAAAGALNITYVAGEVSALSGRYDLVTAMEVIEHVNDPADFVAALVAKMAKGGLLIISTPNRTAKAKLAMINLAEGFGQIPKGTHDWDKFLTPEELGAILADHGLTIIEQSGISWSPGKGLHLSPDMSLNYIIAATK